MSPAFFSDCVETLEEIALGLNETFQEAGGDQLIALDCLNASEEGMEVLEYLSRRELKDGLIEASHCLRFFGGSSRFSASHVWLYSAWDGLRGVVSKSGIPLDFRAASRCVDLCRFRTIHGCWLVGSWCFLCRSVYFNSRFKFTSYFLWAFGNESLPRHADSHVGTSFLA